MIALRKATLAAAAAFALGGFSAAPALAETWDMPMAYAASNFHSETATAFAEAVTERTGGDIEVVAHPGGSLYGGGEIFRAVRTGQAPIGERLMSALGNEDPLFEVDALPFLATSYEDARNLYEASKPAVSELMDGMGLVFLYAVPWPPQGLYSKTAVESAADMEGQKFRAYNAATSRLAELMGAVPTQIEAAEISQAFATGVATSMISSGATGYDRKIWEHVDYWYDVQAWLPKNMVFVNKEAWEGLDEETRQIFLEEAAKAEEAGWAKSQELAEWYKEQLSSEGMTVAPPSDALAADFREIGETMTQEWLERAGDAGGKVAEDYRGM